MNPDDKIEEGLNKWRNNKGVGSIFIPAPFDNRYFILGALMKMYASNPNREILVIVPTYDDRTSFIELITTVNDEETNKEFKHLVDAKWLKIYTISIFDKWASIPEYKIVMFLNPTEFNDIAFRLLNRSKFKLVVMNKLVTDKQTELMKVCPTLDDYTTFVNNELRASTPVEEYRIGVTIPEDTDDYKLLQYYNEYISTSLNIFGSFDTIQKCRVGDQTFNMSAMQICQQIATENGWHDHLDMSIEFNVQIDTLYNPNSISERANKTYEIIRLRQELVSCYKGKLEEINKIVEENPAKKILIINKKASFARMVTEYLNTYSIVPVAGNYHTDLEKIPAVNLLGKPVFVKNGENKGERKVMGARAQCTLNVQRFNANMIRVLSANNAPDKSLAIDVDIVIITSPLCEDIRSYIYRLGNVNFSTKLQLFSIYVINSFEIDKLQGKIIGKNHTIKKDCEIGVINENNSSFIIAD